MSGSRERKRTQRQKRKRRSTEPPDAGPDDALSVIEDADASANGGGSVSRSELRNRKARSELKPLYEGERPLIVTVGAVVAAILALLSAVGWALWETLRDDVRPPVAGVIVFVALFATMSWGMWKARYWAVLGFQTVLMFVIVLSSLAIVRATTVVEALGDLGLTLGAGILFYFMVRAMARIQMPNRDPRD